MEDRRRVNLSLAPRMHEDLQWLAAELCRVPAELARDMVAGGIAEALSDPAMRAARERDRGRGSAEDRLLPDIARALAIEGVPAVLCGDRTFATPQAVRVAAWLAEVSRWLADPRPEAAKGEPVGLAEWKGLYVARDDVGPALALAGHADGQGALQVGPQAPEKTSNKRALSDVGHQRKGGRGRAGRV